MAQHAPAHSPGHSTAQSPPRDSGGNWFYWTVAWFTLNYIARLALAHRHVYRMPEEFESQFWIFTFVLFVTGVFVLSNYFRKARMFPMILRMGVDAARAEAGSYEPDAAFHGLHKLHDISVEAVERRQFFDIDRWFNLFVACLIAAIGSAIPFAGCIVRDASIFETNILVYLTGSSYIFAHMYYSGSRTQKKACNTLDELQTEIGQATLYYHETQQEQKVHERNQRRPFMLPPSERRDDGLTRGRSGH